MFERECEREREKGCPPIEPKHLSTGIQQYNCCHFKRVKFNRKMERKVIFQKSRNFSNPQQFLIEPWFKLKIFGVYFLFKSNISLETAHRKDTPNYSAIQWTFFDPHLIRAILSFQLINPYLFSLLFSVIQALT